MSRKTDTLGQELDKLAAKIVDELLDDGVVPSEKDGEPPRPIVTLEQRLEGMRIVGAYLVAKMKVKAKLPDETDDNVADFDKLKATLRTVK